VFVAMSSYGKLRPHGDASKPKQLTWTRVTRLVGKAPSWESLDIYGEDFYNDIHKTGIAIQDIRTEDGNCLVATLCYPAGDNLSLLFQCSIPRGTLPREYTRGGTYQGG
jgi:hypothetical protein